MALTASEHKPRSQGKLVALPEDQRRQIRDWMASGDIYSVIAQRIKESFGVSISKSSLSEYYSKHNREILSRSAEPAVPPAVQHVKLVLHIQIQAEVVNPGAK